MSRYRGGLRVALLLAATWMVGGCEERDQSPGASTVLRIFGRTGLGPVEFSYPRASFVGLDGLYYVVDKVGRIQVLTATGEFVREWTMPEVAAGKPTGFGMGPEGRIYIADTHYARVAIYEPDGTLVRMIGGQRGRGPGQFIMPTDVAVDADGFIFVGEYGGNDRISKFSPEGDYLFSFGQPGNGPGELQRPQALVFDREGVLWVADSCNHRICSFTRGGEFLAAFGQSGRAPGQMRFPYGLDWLADGTLVVAEYGNSRIQRFDRAGRSLGTWGSAGRRPGELAYPWSVSVGPRDQLFVLDSGNNRVQVLKGASGAGWQRP